MLHTTFIMIPASTLAQAGGPATPGAPAPSAPAATPSTGTPALPGAPANPAAGAPGTTARPPGGGFDMLLVMMLVLVAMVVFTSFAGRKQRKAREAMIAGLKRNDRVVTTGGVIGTVVELYDQEMVLRVDEQSNTRIRFRRGVVDHVLRDGGQSGSVEAKPANQTASTH